ncbi:MAG TPA: HlyD family secretion protein, partial [Gemmatimonadales bacterium]|nr:HlyD family secretion protein [Gemmatimonadales bacterium]
LQVNEDALLVPQRAVSELQGGFRVVVVGADGKAEFRAVELGARVGDLWVVEKGLRFGENVIVVGLQHVRPGMAVTATPAPQTQGRSES